MRMQQRMLDKIAAIPGVEAVAMTSNGPMEKSGWHDLSMRRTCL